MRAGRRRRRHVSVRGLLTRGRSGRGGRRPAGAGLRAGLGRVRAGRGGAPGGPGERVQGGPWVPPRDGWREPCRGVVLVDRSIDFSRKNWCLCHLALMTDDVHPRARRWRGAQCRVPPAEPGAGPSATA